MTVADIFTQSSNVGTIKVAEELGQPLLIEYIEKFGFGRKTGVDYTVEAPGILRFDVGGEPRQLTAYTFNEGAGESLFVPFLDATSGRETYGAGRYLDLEPEEDGSYTLDFNLAYHPSCVYDAKYSCPLTPAENRLPVRIEAGERLPATA